MKQALNILDNDEDNFQTFMEHVGKIETQEE
jgi:hypothetical protein